MPEMYCAVWVLAEDKDISWEHCGRPAYWDNDEVYCSKCQEMLSDDSIITERVTDWEV